MLDAIVSNRLLSYMTRNKLISTHQFGLLPQKSTVMQLVYVINQWLNTREKGRESCAIFMDFVKAFDRVWHPGLLFKLSSTGASPDCTAWFRSYLSERTITVRVGTALSPARKITAGVPQGSHLGPVLFLLFINDLPSHVNMSTELYADDALPHQEQVPGSNYMEVEEAISDAERWATSWHGSFGHTKTKLLMIASP